MECGVFRRRVGFFGESFSCLFFVVVYFWGDRDAYPLCIFSVFYSLFFRCRPRLVCVVVSVLLRVSCSLMDVLCLCLGWMCVCVCVSCFVCRVMVFFLFVIVPGSSVVTALFLC